MWVCMKFLVVFSMYTLKVLGIPTEMQVDVEAKSITARTTDGAAVDVYLDKAQLALMGQSVAEPIQVDVSLELTYECPIAERRGAFFHMNISWQKDHLHYHPTGGIDSWGPTTMKATKDGVLTGTAIFRQNDPCAPNQNLHCQYSFEGQVLSTLVRDRSGKVSPAIVVAAVQDKRSDPKRFKGPSVYESCGHSPGCHDSSKTSCKIIKFELLA